MTREQRSWTTLASLDTTCPSILQPPSFEPSAMSLIILYESPNILQGGTTRTGDDDHGMATTVFPM
jgi:hypothetical protein